MVLLVVLGLLWTPSFGWAAAPLSTWVVEFVDGLDVIDRGEVLGSHGVEVLDVAGWGPFALVSADASQRDALERLAAIRRVRKPMPVSALAEPDDPHFSRQWNLRAVQAPAAWDVTAGAGAVVAVLDTGVDRTLPDLQGTRFSSGFDFIDGDADPRDDNGHGSHVTGTVSQTTNNGIGVAGLAYEATVMPVRVLDAQGSGNDYVLAQGIHHAVSNGADVINLSLGGAGSTTALYAAVQLAAAEGVTIVAAAGNDGEARVRYPAAYEEVIAVGAVDQGLTLASYSNTGGPLDVVAPGGDLSQDLDGDGYGDGILQQTFVAEAERRPCLCFYQGTSMAAPHVAAAAAMIVAEHDASRQVVREALLGSARDLGPAGTDTTYGAGLLQTAAALAAAAELVAVPEPGAPPATPSPPPTGEPVGEPLPEAPVDEPTAEDPVPEPDQSTLGRARDVDDACPPGEVPDGGFRDVDGGSPHTFAVDCVAWRSITQGVSPGVYAPGSRVSRAQMASFLANAIEDVGGSLPPDPPDAFTDDDRSPHARNIDRLAAAGIVKGQLDRTYQPSNAVTRAQMATFLARTARHLTGDALTSRVDYFDDDAGNLHQGEINAMAHVGVATGVDVRSYSPAQAVRRDQMASFLARMLDLVIEACGAGCS